MAAGQKAFKTYRQGGITGVYTAVTQCYGHLRPGQKALERSVEFCVALDIGGVVIDSEVASAEHFPRDPRFMEVAAANRINAVLRRYGMSASNDDTTAYFAARVGRIQKYTNDAAQLDSHAVGQSQIAHYKKQVVQAATRECDGDTGDGVATTAYSGNLAGVGPVTVISAGSNGCAGGQAPRNWLWVFFADGSSSQTNQPPNQLDSLAFSDDQIVVKSLEVGQEDSPNFPSHLTQLTYKVNGRKLMLAGSRFLAIRKE